MNETDGYRELASPGPLRGAIACMWVRYGDGGHARVVPDACCDIVWRPRSGAVVAGPDTHHWFSRTEPGELIVGVRFLPGAGGPALGVPLSELRNQRVPLDALDPTLDRALSNATDPRDALLILSAAAARWTTAAPPDRAVQAAIARLRDPRQRIEPLARELGFSERQLRRRFLDSVGYGPKTLQRVLRLRGFLAKAPGDLARAAQEAGYSDQAHLTRECRQLTGLTPRVLT